VVNTEDLALLDEVQLSPGMPADVMILNDEQTLIDYMLGPILQSMRRSFHEN
jgi:F420-0:gamma-glutamyl ligase-like protein